MQMGNALKFTTSYVINGSNSLEVTQGSGSHPKPQHHAEIEG